MALIAAKSGGIPPAIPPVSRVHHAVTDVSALAPLVALGTLILVAGIILWLRITG